MEDPGVADLPLVEQVWQIPEVLGDCVEVGDGGLPAGGGADQRVEAQQPGVTGEVGHLAVQRDDLVGGVFGGGVGLAGDGASRGRKEPVIHQLGAELSEQVLGEVGLGGGETAQPDDAVGAQASSQFIGVGCRPGQQMLSGLGCERAGQGHDLSSRATVRSGWSTAASRAR